MRRKRTARIAWDSTTTLVLVEISAGGVIGMGYTYRGCGRRGRDRRRRSAERS